MRPANLRPHRITAPKAALHRVTPPKVTLNTDGRPHPLENALTVFTLACGLVAFVTGFIAALHLVASAVGLVGFVVGLYAQLISATTAERCVIVTGLVGSFVGLGLGIANGGFGI